jgi:hypothetical protein
MQFLFVRPGLCLRLPSDSQSPTTPLPLANDSYCQVHSGLSPQVIAHAGRTTTKSRVLLSPAFYFYYMAEEVSCLPLGFLLCAFVPDAHSPVFCNPLTRIMGQGSRFTFP